MIKQPLANVYRKLNATQQRFIRQALWEVYKIQLLKFLADARSLYLTGNEAELLQLGDSFVATGSDPNDLYTMELYLAHRDGVDTIEGICLLIIEKNREQDEQTDHAEVGHSLLGQDVMTTCETMMKIFPELRSRFTELGLVVQHEQAVAAFEVAHRQKRQPIH